MRRRRPDVASLDELRITRDADEAIIEYVELNHPSPDGACSVSQGSQRETRNARKVLSVPRQQDTLVRQGDAGDQAVAHAYRLPMLLEGPSHLGGSICPGGVEGQARQSLEELDEHLLLPGRTRPSAELEAGHGGCGELGVFELECDAFCG